MPATAVDPEMAAESPKKPLVAPSSAVSSACWDQAVPERVNTCTAPVPELRQGAPTTVVDPETATEYPRKSPRRRRSSFPMSFFFPRVFGQQEHEDEGGCQGDEAGP